MQEVRSRFSIISRFDFEHEDRKGSKGTLEGTLCFLCDLLFNSSAEIGALKRARYCEPSDDFWGWTVTGWIFRGITPMSQSCREEHQTAAMSLPGAAEVGSAGKKSAKEYPSLRCAQGVSASGRGSRTEASRKLGSGRMGAMPP